MISSFIRLCPNQEGVVQAPVDLQGKAAVHIGVAQAAGMEEVVGLSKKRYHNSL